MCYNVGEMHAGVHGRLIVPESSARQAGYKFLAVNANHFDICRPERKVDSSFQSLTNCISKVIKNHEDKQQHLLDLPDRLVGMDDMQNFICEKLGTISIIGLVGMGGIGKTTMSKSVYNSQAKYYDKSCFLQDVRSKGVASVQRELLEALCGEVRNIGCVRDVQPRSIQQCILQRKVLVVIDDVGDSQTLKSLEVHTFKSSSKGSRVIVTCRNREVLGFLEHSKDTKGLKNVEITEVELLNDAQGLQLLCYHVFHRVEDEDDEMKDFQGLAVDIAKACCGLPLSLEVIGQHLRRQHAHYIGTRKEIWEEALTKLREAKAFGGGTDNEVLWKSLMISYDDLDDCTKSMFLDFACLLCEKSPYSLYEKSIGWIWNSHSGLQDLLARSLIKVGGTRGEGRWFTMHDQLRDMGRSIVKKAALKGLHVSLEKVTRLWEKKEIVRFLEENEVFLL